jgi:hypothetical protein
MRSAIKAQARNDGLRLLRAIDETQAAQEGGLDVGDVGSDRYHHALGYLLDEAALLGDERTATEAGVKQPHGYALYFVTRRAVKLLEASKRSVELLLGKAGRIVRGFPYPRRQKYSGQQSRFC